MQEICPAIHQRINEIAYTFLSTWNLDKEAPELSQWQNFIDYLVAKNEELEESDSTISAFMIRAKEKEKEILDMRTAIQKYLNRNAELKSPTDIFDFCIGKSILDIIVDKVSPIGESIQEVYKLHIYPTRKIWDLYCMIQTRNHICNSESMNNNDIVFFTTTTSNYLTGEQFDYLVSYIRIEIELVRGTDNEAKHRALSVFCLTFANLIEELPLRLKTTVDEAFKELIRSTTSQPTIIGAIASSCLSTVRYFSSRSEQWWNESIRTNPKAICSSSAQFLSAKGMTAEASLCRLASQYDLDFDTATIASLKQMCSLFDDASAIEMKKVVDIYDINDFFLAESCVYQITENSRTKIQNLKRGLLTLNTDIPKEVYRNIKGGMTDFENLV